MTAVLATAGNNQATITWTPPANAEAIELTDYFIKVTPDARAVKVAAPASSAVVSGLRNGTEYEFTVYAATSDGSSDPSEAVRATPSTGMEGEVAGLIVKFEAGTSVAEGQLTVPGEEKVDSVDLQVADTVGGGAVLVDLSESVLLTEAKVIAGELASSDKVAWAEPDQFLFTSSDPLAQPVTVPDDSSYASDQWNLWDTNGVGIGDGTDAMTKAWSGGTGAGATVAVIDTGITPHEDLDSQLVSGYDFVSSPAELDAARTSGGSAVSFDGDYVSASQFGAVGRDSNPADPGDWRGVAPTRDSSWHGTKMAGIIAAQARNSAGITGIAPGSKIQPIRALSWRGGLLSDIASSITWASGGHIDGITDNATPSDVINMSFAVQATCPVALQNAIDEARQRGAVLVAAAGNANDDVAKYAPANCNGVITVGATDRSGMRAPYSNYGERIDISAPGGDINSGGVLSTSNTGTTDPADQGYAADQGTSIAAAHVSAAAALIASRDQALTPDAITTAITGKSIRPFANTTCDTDPTKTCGDGILNLAQIASVAVGDQDFSMSFSGSDASAVGDGSQAAFQITGAITIEAWAKLDNCSSTRALIRKWDEYGILCASGDWNYFIGGTSSPTLSTGIPVRLGQWQHIALVRPAGQDLVNFYVDGQLAYTGTTGPGGAGTGSIRTSSNILDVGSNQTIYEKFVGQIDEVRLYSAALTQAQITVDMHTHGMNTSISASDQRAYFDFNEGPAGTTGSGTVYNRADGATSATNLRTVNGPTYADIKQTTSSGSNTVVTFPRSYLTAAGGWRAPDGVSTVDRLLVGGGGSGGSGRGGGGGAGGFGEASQAVTPGAVVSVKVGQGGVGITDSSQGNTGQSSQLGTSSVDGGGGGGSWGTAAGLSGASGGGGAGKDGGSGGATSGNGVGFAGGSGSSTATGSGGGGGGAGAVGTSAGTNAGAGGSGRASSITGASVTYAGGGGGASNYYTPGAGGSGGGGAGCGPSACSATAGTAGLGGGGGGAEGGSPNRSGSGGSGIVIVSYSTSAASTCAPESTQYTSGGTTYRVVAFKDTGTCNWAVPSGVTSVDYLVVAGGGGGGSRAGGGGGAGGMLESTSSNAVTAGQAMTVTVGSGGSGGAGGTAYQQLPGSAGANSSITGGGLASTITAIGGGSGGAGATVGSSGGSGGGSMIGAGGSGTSRQGTSGGSSVGTASQCTGSTNGYCASGGGGKASAGEAADAGGNNRAGNGGAGDSSALLTVSVATVLGIGSVSGSNVQFAGGGGGGIDVGGTSGTGGTGGGGSGGAGTGQAVNGAATTGGGGGGGGYQTNLNGYTDVSSPGGSGGSGVVVLRYVQNAASGTCVPATTQYVSSGSTYQVVAFKNVGSCTWTVPIGVTSVDYLVVAGGGGGGSDVGGGGGAGGLRTATGTAVTAGATVNVTVGAGGAGANGTMGGANARGADGTGSTLTDGGLTSSIETAGGGGGGSGGTVWSNYAGLPGGSGGGSAIVNAGTFGAGDTPPTTPAQGKNGGLGSGTDPTYRGGGGGGAGAVGGNATSFSGGSGGVGKNTGPDFSWLSGSTANSLGIGEVSGEEVYFASGGGGGGTTASGVANNGGVGGLGGGGDGSAGPSGSSASAATGGGGGGGGRNNSTIGSPSVGGAGGSGVVILRYVQPSSTACTPSESTYTSGGTTYTIVEFQGAGTCSWTPPAGVASVDVLAVGGGGGGGSRIGGGGGGGGVVPATSLALAGTAVSVTVGAGGAGGGMTSSGSTSAGGIGGSSVFSSVTALGGGGGGSNGSYFATSGASGGGVGYPGCPGTAGAGTAGSGAAGGTCTLDAGRFVYAGGGGGGGSSGVAGTNGASIGLTAGQGGSGTASAITGSSVFYGGGGGAGVHTDTATTLVPGVGGRGGGGTGAAMVSLSANTGAPGNAGQDGLGGGGGGGSVTNGSAAEAIGGDGGDGVVIVSYSIVPGAPTSVTGSASAPTTATVSWTAPTHTGGSSITGYSVVVSAGGGAYAAAAAGTCTSASSSTSTSCTVTGLTAGTTYAFKVTAINANGNGTQSDASAGITAYGALSQFAVTATDGSALGTQVAGTSFNVKITARDSGGRTVTNFTGTVDLTSTSLFSSGTSTTTSAFTAGVLSSHAVTLLRAGSSQTVTATKTSSTETGTSGTFTINAGTATKLQVLLPGETAAPGTASGKTAATPTAQSATTSFNATVNAVDANWNVVSSATPTVRITSSDSAATLPANAALVAGTKAFAVTLATSGSATVTATDQAGSSPLTAGTSASVTVNRTSQAALTMSSAATVAFGSTLTLTTSGGSGTGAITYAVTTTGTAGCSISGSTLSVTGDVGASCAVTATKAQDSSYSSASSAAQTITVGTRSITVTASSPSIAYGAVVSPTVSVTTGTLSGSDAISGAIYMYTGSGGTTYGPLTTAPSAVGSYLITPSAATFSSGSSSNYAITYATGTLTISQAAQATLSISSASSVAFGSTLTLTTSGGSGDGAVSYAVTTAGTAGCSISGTTLSVSGNVGATCAVTATKAADASYLVASSSAQTITVSTRSITVTASSPSIAFGASVSPTVSVTTGSLSGSDTISGATYTYTGTGGTTYGPLATAPTAVGTYTVTPSVATFSSGSSTNYAISYAAGTLTISQASQATLSMSSASTVTFGGTLTLTTSGGSGSGAVTYAVTTTGTAGCSISGTTLSVSGDAGTTCAVTATKAADASYLVASSTAQTITIGTRSISVTASSPSVAFGAAVSPSVSVTSGTLSGSDAISGATYTYVGTGSTTYASSTTAPTAVGTYSVTPSAATFSSGSSSNYAIQYAAGTLTITQAAQATLSMSSASTLDFGGSLTISTSGGSGTGAVTYAVSTAGTAGCSISGTTLSVSGDSGSTCAVTATKAADTSYLSASSSAQTITVTTRSITVTASSPSIAYGAAVSPSVSVTTGSLSGSDAISGATYTYTGTGGTTYGPLTTAPTAVGTYSVAPSAAAFSSGLSSNYAISYSAGTLTISQAAQATLGFAVTSATLGGTTSLAITGGSGSGAVTYALDAAGTASCSLSGSTLSYTSGGTCTISATKAADASYLSATTGSVTFTVSGPSTATSTITASSASITADGTSTSTITVQLKDSSGTNVTTDSATVALSTTAGTLGSVTYAGSGSYTATLTSPTTVGSATISGTLNSLAMSSSATVTFVVGAATKIVTVWAPVAAASGADLATQPVVRITDANNNTVTSSTASVTVAAGAGTLSGTLTVSAVNGVATFAGLSFTGSTTSATTLTFSSSGLTPTTADITPTGPGSAAALAITGSASQTAGDAQSITITATDAAGNTVTSYTGDKSITFTGASSSLDGTAPTVTSKTGAAVSFGTATTITFTNGVATVSSSSNGVMRLYKAESATVSVTDGSISSAGSDRLSVAVSAASANQLAMATQPVAAASGSALSTQPVVTVRDAYGNTTASTATVTVSASGGTLGGAESSAGKAAVSGTATFSDLTFAGLTTTTYTLTFASSGLTAVTSSSITPNAAGPVAQFAVTQSGGTTPLSASTYTAGTSLAMRVTAQDSGGNTVTTFSGSVVLTSTAWSSTRTASSFVNGVKDSVSASLRTAATGQTIQAVYSVGSITTNPASSAFTVVAGSATQLLMDTEPVGGAAGTVLATQPIVRVADAYDNTVTGSSATITAGQPSGSGWNLATGSSQPVPNKLAFGNGTWLSVGYYSSISRSTDGGDTWSDVSPSGSVGFWDAAYGGGVWVAASNSGLYTSTNNGSTWTRTSTTASNFVAYGNGLWVAAGQTSTDGTTWTSRSGIADSSGMAYANGVFCSADGSRSYDGLTWTGASKSGGLGVTYGNGTWVISGSGWLAASATCSGTWSTSTFAPAYFKDVAFGEGIFTTVGYSSTDVYTSRNGTTWTTQAALPAESWSAVGYGAGTWLIGGDVSTGWRIYRQTNPYPSLSGILAVAAQSGIATWTDLVAAGLVSTNYQVRFTSGSLTAVTSGNFTVTAGSMNASGSTVTAAASQLTAGSGTTTVTVQLRDVAGNPVSATGRTVAMSSNIGTLGSVTDNGGGSYSATFTAPATTGQAVVSATVDGTAIPSKPTVWIVAGAASALAISTQPVAGASGATMTTQPVVRIVDASGNTVSSSTASVTVTAGTGTLGGTTTVSATSGVATFSGVTFAGLSSTTHTLTFESSGLTSATTTVQPTGAGSAATIAVNAGNNQSATAGSAVATAPSVLVTDSGGNPVSGRSITFTVASGGGSRLPATTVNTNSSGIATLTSWTLGTTAGANTLTAASTGLTGSPVTFTATGTVGAATRLVLSTSAVGTTSGAAFTTQPAVTIQDANANVVNSNSSSIVTATISAGGALVGTTTATAVNGVATFSNLGISGAAGTPYTITFSSGSLTTATQSITPSAGAAASLSVTRASVGTASGAAFTTQPQISVKDAADNTVTAYAASTVTATVSSGGTLVGTRTATTSSGVATFSNLGITGTVGTTYTITYSLGALTAATATVTVTVGVASTIAINGGNSQSATAGSAVATAPSVLVTDSGGNAVSGTSVTFAVASGAGSVSGGSATTNSSGIASPTSWTLGTTVGSNTLTATSGSLAGSPITFSATGTVGAASQLVLTTSAVGTASGTAFSTQPVVTIKDANSNMVTTDSASVVTASVSAGGTLLGTTTATAVNGVATFTDLGISGTAGNTYVITYSSGALTPVTQNVTVTAGTATQVVLTTSAAGATYGNTWTTQPVVQIRDSAGNVRTTDSSSVVTISVSTGAAIVGTATATASSGVATFSGLALTGAPATYTLTYSTGALTSATQVLALSQASQSVTFGALSTKTYGDAAFGLSATASSGLSVTFASADSSICSVSGSAVSIVGAGTCTITATQTGNTYYSAATPVAQAFTINQANQAVLVMTSASSAIYGETIALAASGGSGTGALVFGVTAGTCTVSGTTLTLGNALSNCRVQATKVSDANYNSTTSSVQTITIARAGQVVSFTSAVPASPLPNGTYTPAASSISTVTGSSSGLTPVFTIRGSSSAVCSISGGVVSFLTTGNCVIDADSALTTNFTAAATATQTISVGSLNQNITFAQPSNVAFGTASVSMGATASSDLTVSYSLGNGTTNSACTVSTLGVVTILAVGTCEVTAAQIGDAQYAAASPVTRAFQVVASLASAPYLTSASAGDQSITVAFAAPGFTGGVSITAYRIVATPVSSGTTVTTSACTSSPCTISGLANGTSYTVTAAAINTAGTGPASSASTALTPATAAFAVSGLAATPGNANVVLSWTPLTNAQLGGGTFTRYVVSKRVAGTNPWIQVTNALTSQSTSSYTVTGLENGTSYDFQLVAVTSANASEIPGNTAEVVQYPSTAPSAPRSLTTLAATATDLQVSWQSPLSDGGAPLISPYYSVTVTSTSSGAVSPITCTFASVTDRFCTAANLTNGALYSVIVGAINRMGTGTLATTTYAVPSSDATLADLEVNDTAGTVALSPAFASGITVYTAEVANDIGAVTVTATTTMGGSTFTVNGTVETSGVASASIPLDVGTNTITVLVTASDVRFDETYEIEIIRAPSNSADGRSWTPPLEVSIPATSLINGSRVGAVTESGSLVPTVLDRNPTDSGWRGVGEGFSFSIETRTASGAPQRMTAGGVMRVPAGGTVAIRSDGYLPDSSVTVFAVPRAESRSAAQSVLRLLAGRDASDSIYLGSASVNSNGAVNDSIGIPARVDAGDYVLQINGYTPTSQVRSMNLALNVLAPPKSDASEVKFVSRQLVAKSFYEARSDRFTADGLVKMRDVAKSIPKDARNVKVKIAGASVGLGSISENVALAGKRAERIADYLVARGIQGDYEITFTTSFKVGGDRDGATDKVDKPLTTIRISYDVPAATT